MAEDGVALEPFMVVDLVQNSTTLALSYSIYRGTDFRVEDDANGLE